MSTHCVFDQAGATFEYEDEKHARNKHARQEAWAAATEFMPFNAVNTLPWCTPSKASLSEQEAKVMFEAFDTNSDGILEETEIRGGLSASKVPSQQIEHVASTLFGENSKGGNEPVTWDTFRLWIRRRKFAHRNVGILERIFLTLENPLTSKTAMFWSFIVTALIVASVVLFMLESLPSWHTQACIGCIPQLVNKNATFEMAVIAIFSFEYVARLVTAPFVYTIDTEITPAMKKTEEYLHFVHHELDGEKLFQSSVTTSGFKKVYQFLMRPMNLVVSSLVFLLCLVQSHLFSIVLFRATGSSFRRPFLYRACAAKIGV